MSKQFVSWTGGKEASYTVRVARTKTQRNETVQCHLRGQMDRKVQ